MDAWSKVGCRLSAVVAAGMVSVFGAGVAAADVTYTWTGQGEDARWSTPENWSSTEPGLTPGYPTEWANVVWPNLEDGIDIVADVSADYTGKILLNHGSERLRLTGDGSTTIRCQSSVSATITSASSNVLDGVIFKGMLDEEKNAYLQYYMSGYYLRLTNGAVFDVVARGTEFFCANSTFVIEDGSRYSCSSVKSGMTYGNGSTMGSQFILDNGELHVSPTFDFNYNGAANDLQVVIRGTNSLFEAMLIQSTNPSGGFLFDPGYPLVRPPVQTTRQFPTAGTICLAMERGPHAALRRTAESCDLTLVQSDAQILLNKVTFGDIQREGDYFFFEDTNGNQYRSAAEVPAGATVRKIGYHHNAPPGFLIMVR